MLREEKLIKASFAIEQLKIQTMKMKCSNMILNTSCGKGKKDTKLRLWLQFKQGKTKDAKQSHNKSPQMILKWK